MHTRTHLCHTLNPDSILGNLVKGLLRTGGMPLASLTPPLLGRAGGDTARPPAKVPRASSPDAVAGQGLGLPFSVGFFRKKALMCLLLMEDFGQGAVLGTWDEMGR